jgi:hypothetical protein
MVASARAPILHACNADIRDKDVLMKLFRRRLLDLSRLTGTIGFAVALAAPTASDAAEIKVLTSRGMNHVLNELAGAFHRTSEHKVVLILRRSMRAFSTARTVAGTSMVGTGRASR